VERGASPAPRDPEIAPSREASLSGTNPTLPVLLLHRVALDVDAADDRRVGRGPLRGDRSSFTLRAGG
ncbi:MAG TPA: GntR family transcriptional regulator, partial [Pseudonocardia sp.]|nr:GntR family transcriptional regulator [Pseudonocardia sp.]